MVVQDKITVDWAVDTMKFLVEQTKELYTCNRPPGAAGAMLVDVGNMDERVLVAGVMPPQGSPTCKEVGCEMVWETYEVPDESAEFGGHCIRTIHAEQMLIASAANYGIETNGMAMFSILKPCYQCSKLIIAAGIKKIYYAGAAYDEERTRKILENAGVECIHVDVGLEYGNV